MSFDNLSASNCFVSKGALVIRSLTNYANNNDSKSRLLQQSVMNVGSAYTQGNVVTIPVFDYNATYLPTEEDIIQTKSLNNRLFKDFPLLNEYPWLVPLSIKNTLGRGNGTIEIYNVAPSLNGLYSRVIYMDQYYNLNISGDIPLQPAPKNVIGPEFPFSGSIYSGQLVQYYFDNKNIKVIPYQAGRGVPQWDITQEYYSGNPWGIPLRLGTPLEPRLSPGAAPGNNDFCLGIVQESSGRCPLFGYQKPDDLTKTQSQWYNKDHPSPFSLEPRNLTGKKNGPLTSPQNYSLTNWAPWPRYYSYQTDEQIPVLTKGITNATIGAAYNIGMQCYYEPEVEPGDDPRGNPKYLPVQTIPLFQGEKVKLGSEIYSTVMGHIITWDRRGESPYPVASPTSSMGNTTFNIIGLGTEFFFFLYQGNLRDSRDENPWWDWCDPTMGAIGWCGTPGFSLTNIPDEGVPLCRAIDGEIIPSLAQSLQGSVIVRATSTINPLDNNGSGRMELINSAEYCESDAKFRGLVKMPGDSERGQVIGSSMQEIAGTGRWSYDGSYPSLGGTPINGFLYQTGLYNLVPSNPLSGGIDGVIDVTSVDANGSILTFDVINLGYGYTEGELLRIVNDDTYPKGTPYYKENCAVVRYSSGTFIMDSRGSRYKSKYGCIGYNITKNLGLIPLDIKFDNQRSDEFDVKDYAYGKVSNTENYTLVDKNTNLFTINRRFWPLNFFSSQKINKESPLMLFEEASNLMGRLTTFTGDPFAYEQGIKEYSIQFDGAYQPMEITVIASEDGQVEDFKITDYGLGHENGDLILVYQYNSDNNYIFEYSVNSLEVGRLVAGGAGYIFAQNNNIKWVNPRNIYDIKSTSLLIKAMSTDKSGTLNNLSWNVEQYNYTQFVNLPLGSKQIVSQTIQIEPGNYPISEPWDLYAKTENATFYLDAYSRIINPGSGYQSGEYGTVEAGGLIVLVTADQGVVVNVSIIDYGISYHNEIKTINGGDGNCKIMLKINTQDSVYNYKLPTSASINTLFSCLNYNYELLSPGTNYSVMNYNTTCPNRPGQNMIVSVLSVGINGEVEALDIIDEGNALYNIGDVVTITNGVIGEDAYFRIVAPREPQKVRWHIRGTGYTTGTNIPTYNLQQNNLIIAANTSTGGCVPYNTVGFTGPYFWDLSRYEPNDVVRIIQGTNSTCIQTMTTINYQLGTITWGNISNGVGYTTGISDNGWFRTVNDTAGITLVDIEAVDGEITNVVISSLSPRARVGDMILIEQPGSDLNAVIQLSPLKSVIPWWEERINGRQPTSEQWNEYRDALKSGVNLMDYPISLDFKPNYPNYFNNSYYNNGDGGRDFVNNNGCTAESE